MLKVLSWDVYDDLASFSYSEMIPCVSQSPEEH